MNEVYLVFRLYENGTQELLSAYSNKAAAAAHRAAAMAVLGVGCHPDSIIVDKETVNDEFDTCQLWNTLSL